jgi:hypothetical protein
MLLLLLLLTPTGLGRELLHCRSHCCRCLVQQAVRVAMMPPHPAVAAAAAGHTVMLRCCAWMLLWLLRAAGLSV